MKEKHGEYIYLDGDLDYHVVKGHVSREEARQVVCSENGWPREEDPFTIEHHYARLVPCTGFDWDMMFILCEKGRGAFPVTTVDN